MSRPSAEPTATVDGAGSQRVRDEEVYVWRRHGKAVRLGMEVTCGDPH
jgi:hypothetical protein